MHDIKFVMDHPYHFIVQDPWKIKEFLVKMVELFLISRPTFMVGQICCWLLDTLENQYDRILHGINPNDSISFINSIRKVISESPFDELVDSLRFFESDLSRNGKNLLEALTSGIPKETIICTYPCSSSLRKIIVPFFESHKPKGRKKSKISHYTPFNVNEKNQIEEYYHAKLIDDYQKFIFENQDKRIIVLLATIALSSDGINVVMVKTVQRFLEPPSHPDIHLILIGESLKVESKAILEKILAITGKTDREALFSPGYAEFDLQNNQHICTDRDIFYTGPGIPVVKNIEIKSGDAYKEFINVYNKDKVVEATPFQIKSKMEYNLFVANESEEPIGNKIILRNNYQVQVGLNIIKNILKSKL